MTQPRKALAWTPLGARLVGGWLLLLAVVTSTLLVTRGSAEPVLSQLARFGAQSAFAMFFLSFGASPLADLFPGAVTRWLRAQRRYLGVCFALSHFLFLGANITRVVLHYDGAPLSFRDPLSWITGGAGYVVITAMLVTSFPRPAAWLGPKRWQLLHRFGGYALLGGFLNSYGFRAWFYPETYLVHGLLVLSLLVLRLVWEWRRRRAPQPST